MEKIADSIGKMESTMKEKNKILATNISLLSAAINCATDDEERIRLKRKLIRAADSLEII